MTDSLVLETERLVLRPAAIDDLPAVEELWTDPDVRRFLFDDRIVSREEARGFLERSEASFRSDGYGIWLVHERGQEGLAGFSGLLWSTQGTEAAPNLIFGIRPALWNRGYAREAAARVLRYGFEVVELPRVFADVDEPNAASVRVLEKLGMSRTRRAIVNGRPLIYYEVTR
jgi:RimJ/RimL family protein N-acetyltransferase